MVLNKEVREIASSVGDKQSFGFNPDSALFEILSNLYDDRIVAIMRELSTNAYDAHADAGKEDVPFEVHLPTMIEPWFAVRDYGTGMSHEKVLNLYTIYGKSDKTENNDVDGAFGIGSKSPFAYADNFSVESYYNGEKNTYMMYLSEDKTPCVSLVSSENTTEPNGVRIQLATKQEDERWWHQKASRVYFPFRTKPVFNNDIDITNIYDYKEALTIELNDGTVVWFIENAPIRSEIIQGNVAYRVDFLNLNYNWPNEDIRFLDHVVYGRQMVFFEFPQGSFRPAPTRESLQNDDRTVEKLVKAVKELRSKYHERILEKARSADKIYDALSLFSQHTLSTEGEAKDFLAEMVSKFGETGNKWRVLNEGLTMNFSLSLDRKVNTVWWEDIGKRTVRWSIKNRSKDKVDVYDLKDIEESYIVHVDIAKEDQELAWLIKNRIMRHMRHENGELYRVEKLVVVTDYEILNKIGRKPDRHFDDSLRSIKALRKARNASAAGKTRSQAPNYTVLYSDAVELEGKGYTHNDIKDYLSNYSGNVFFMYEEKERGRGNTGAVFNPVDNTERLPIRSDWEAALNTLKELSRMPVTIILVEKSETAKKRFAKLLDVVKIVSYDSIVNSMRAWKDTWFTEKPELKSALENQYKVDSLSPWLQRWKMIVERFVDTYGLSKLSPNSPINEAYQALSRYAENGHDDREKKRIRRFFEFNSLLQQVFEVSNPKDVLEEIENKLDKDFPLIDTLRVNPNEHMQNHLLIYMKGVEIERKKAERKAASQVNDTVAVA